MGRKLRADQRGVFPGVPEHDRFRERNRVLGRVLAERAGLPSPDRLPYENLGNRELPVYQKKLDIQKAIRDHQISMVEGQTGSGKSTQIGQYALEMGYKKIVYLEPRVLLADNLADQIERELASQLGDEAGASLVGVRHSERSTGRHSAIEIMTPATFMRVTRELEAYTDEPLLIVGDEIHEKDFETELAVARSVKLLQHQPKWRMVLASATLDAESIHQAYSSVNNRPIPRTMIEGRPHSLTEIDEPELTPAESYQKYGQDHDKTIIFTAGKQEINDIIHEISGLKIPGLKINRLHAKLSRRDIKRATHATLAPGQRQVIVSTSAGQSGITIPGLTLVITDGTTRRPELDANAVPGLFKEYCAQEEIIQQSGRAGRDVAGGTAVRVKPADPSFDFVPFEERDPQAPAQIYHTNISRNVLLATSFDTDFYELNKYLIHKTDQRTILESYEVLYRLGALDDLNNITKLGQLMNKFPLRPELGRIVAEGMTRGASAETMQHIVAIVSAIEAGGLPYFERGVGTKWQDDIQSTTSDDYIAQLDMFYATREFYHQTEVDEAALEERNYDLKNTYRAHKTFDKIFKTLGLKSIALDTTSPSSEQIQEIHDYLLAGMFDFAHQKVGLGRARLAEYIDVNDRHEPVRRVLTKRGTYAGKDNLVIGMPRRFEKYERGELVRHEVIENVFPTSVQKLARHVLHLLERKPVASSRMVGGRLERRDDLYFGTVKVDDVPSVSRLTHTIETKTQLSEAAYNKPTQTLEELIAIKKELERLVRTIPPGEYDTYFPDGILTDDQLHHMVTEMIDNDVDSIYLLDNKLRSKLVQDKISLRTWLAKDKETELRNRSPEFWQLDGGVEYPLYYSHGQPIINSFNLKDADLLPVNGLYLDDGREILINYKIGYDTKRHSAAVIKEYALQLEGSV